MSYAGVAATAVVQTRYANDKLMDYPFHDRRFPWLSYGRSILAA
jgi:hypothetical protein